MITSPDATIEQLRSLQHQINFLRLQSTEICRQSEGRLKRSSIRRQRELNQVADDLLAQAFQVATASGYQIHLAKSSNQVNLIFDVTMPATKKRYHIADDAELGVSGTPKPIELEMWDWQGLIERKPEGILITFTDPDGQKSTQQLSTFSPSEAITFFNQAVEKLDGQRRQISLFDTATFTAQKAARHPDDVDVDEHEFPPPASQKTPKFNLGDRVWVDHPTNLGTVKARLGDNECFIKFDNRSVGRVRHSRINLVTESCPTDSLTNDSLTPVVTESCPTDSLTNDSLTPVVTESCPTDSLTSRRSVNEYVAKGTARGQVKYFRFSYREGSRIKHVHIPGGNVSSEKAQEKANAVRNAIASGKTIPEILTLIKS